MLGGNAPIVNPVGTSDAKLRFPIGVVAVDLRCTLNILAIEIAPSLKDYSTMLSFCTEYGNTVLI